MPTYSASIDIQASPVDVFAYVGDLTTHPAWAADPLRVEALSADPIRVGSQYRSVAQAQGKTINADLIVTVYEPPQRFGFRATDLTGSYAHIFMLVPTAGGTHVERRITATLSLPQLLLFYVVFPFIKRPNTVAALVKLKALVERGKS